MNSRTLIRALAVSAVAAALLVVLAPWLNPCDVDGSGTPPNADRRLAVLFVAETRCTDIRENT